MNMTQVVERLREENKNNPVASAVFHIFALRHRARSTITLVSLYNKMKLEGFSHSRRDYVPILELLATLGLGTVVVSKKGNVKGLKDINVTLQSIGVAACGTQSDATIKSFKAKHKYVELPKRVRKPSVVQEGERVPAALNNVVGLNLEILVNGKGVHIPVPKDFSNEDITALIRKLA